MYDLTQFRRYQQSVTHPIDVIQTEVAEGLVQRLSALREPAKNILLAGIDPTFLGLSQANYCVIGSHASGQDSMVESYFTALPFDDQSFDRIIVSLQLNWTNDLALCFRELYRVLKPGGALFFSLLGVETLKEIRQAFISCADYLYRFPDMHDVGDLLLHCGFEAPILDMENIQLRYRSIERFFADLKVNGFLNAHQSRPKGLFGKKRWQEALTNYEKTKVNGAYPVTAEIIYVHAWRSGQAKQYERDGEVYISVDQLIDQLR